MAGAWRYSRMRALHASLMGLVMAFDVLFPLYLYLVNDWYRRLIVKEEIFSFSIWMHFMLIVVLYMLYVFQIQAGLGLWRGVGNPVDVRKTHHQQARGILVARLMVFITGVLLIVQ